MQLGREALRERLNARFLLPVLALSVLATYISATVFQLVLLDIAASLGTTPGTASQIPAVARLVGVFVGFITSLFCVKIRHKSLLLFGLVLSAIGALGNSLASDVFSMSLTDSFRGAGFVIVGAMSLALVGELISEEKKGKAVGWLQSSTFLAYLIGFPVTSIIASLAGWRSVMSMFIFPVAVTSLVLVFLVVPWNTSKTVESRDVSYRKAYKEVLSNRCSLGCMLAYGLNFASAAFLVYYLSFYRIQFKTPLSVGSVIGIIGSTTGVLGSIVAGRILKRTGKKRLGVASALINALAIISFLYMPTLISSVILRFVAAFFGSTALVAFLALAVEQSSKNKGTLMSLNTSIGGIGTAGGLAFGGFVLNLLNNYQILMVMLGGFGLASAIVFLVLAKE